MSWKCPKCREEWLDNKPFDKLYVQTQDCVMDKLEIIEFLKNNLSLDIKRGDSYTGGLDSDNLYEEVVTIRLCLDGETISEIDI